jgi:tetratricopeptide (TPR) repeat protein
MKRYFFFLIFIPVVGFSQSDIIKRCIPLIATQKFVEVDALIDSLLRKNPKEPDAWMMKGNSVLNRHLLALKREPIITAADEDMLSVEANGLNSPPQVPEKSVIDSVEQFWKKTLAVDSSREDVYMGLCTVYGMSLQTDKLLACLPVLKKFSHKGDQLGYLMEDYARLLRERGKTADANKVFAAIVTLYPKQSGIWSDWAGEYLFNADLKGALEKADKALQCGTIDESTRENLTDIYLYAQQPEKAVKTIEQYQKGDTSYTYAPLYRALYTFSIGDTLWKKRMTALVAEQRYQNDTNEIIQICKFLSSSIYTGRNHDITMAMLSATLSNFCSWAVIHRAKNDFPDSANVQLIAAEFYLNGKNYAIANSIFKKAGTLKMDSVNRSDMNMVYAYSSYRAGDMLTATTLFNSIVADENLFKRQAALYFLGKMNLPNTLLLKKLVAEQQKTKYFYLGQLLLDKGK